jgi:hypothetical protein
MLSDLRYRLRAFFFRRAVEAEMNDELQLHMERAVEKYWRAGLPPQEAARRARLDFGGSQQVHEECRDARGTRWLEDSLQDLRYALRAYRRSPIFAAVAICFAGARHRRQHCHLQRDRRAAAEAAAGTRAGAPGFVGARRQ